MRAHVAAGGRGVAEQVLGVQRDEDQGGAEDHDRGRDHALGDQARVAGEAVPGAGPPRAEALAERRERLALVVHGAVRHRAVRPPGAVHGELVVGPVRNLVEAGARTRHVSHRSDTTVVRLKAMWATIAGPSRPVRTTR